MPNVEIHGMNRKKAENLRKRMFKAFERESYFEETVITIYPSIVKDSNGENQPFLRLIDDTGDIIDKLGYFGLDLEYVELAFFYTKESFARTRE